MPTFKVHFEASTAIGIEIAVQAADPDAAAAIAANLLAAGKIDVTRLIGELLVAEQEDLVRYAPTSEPGVAVTRVSVQPDVAGFEVVDVLRLAADQDPFHDDS